jgi:hypothetical protein
MRRWCLLAALLAGCESGPRVVVPDSPAGHAVFDDLPAPQGYVYVRNDSNASPGAGFRIVNQVLDGKERRVEQAVQFLKEAYPRQGWTIEKEEGDAKNGPCTLSFTNKTERCVVELRYEAATTVRMVLKVNRKA